MKLDLRPIIDVPGAKVDFHFPLDLREFPWDGPSPLDGPVEVKGAVRNRAGALVLDAEMKTVLHLTCDRCTKAFVRDKSVKYETLLADRLEDENSDDIVLLEDDDSLDLDGLLTDVFILSLDSKNLCKEDCRGLCPGCGADLNVEPCRCKKEIDPRWAKLAQLLEPEKADQ